MTASYDAIEAMLSNNPLNHIHFAIMVHFMGPSEKALAIVMYDACLTLEEALNMSVDRDLEESLMITSGKNQIPIGDRAAAFLTAYIEQSLGIALKSGKVCLCCDDLRLSCSSCISQCP